MNVRAPAEGSPRPKLIDGVRTGALWIGGAFAVVAVLTLGAGPLLFRTGTLGFDAATRGVQAWAMLFFAIGLALGLIGLVGSLARRRQRGSIVAVAVMLVSGYGLGQLYGQTQIRKLVPPLYDIQTDWTQPIAFRPSTLESRAASRAVAVRDDARVAAAGRWSGQTFAEAQASYYDLKPLTTSAPVDVAAQAAIDAARRLGWEVTTSDPPAGEVDAIATEAWYGLIADIAVRVRPEGEGSRIDVRSTSRTPGHDMGGNAIRVGNLLREVDFALARR